MNHLAFFSASLIGISLLSTNCPAQSYLSQDLVAYYPLDGAANDFSGNANDGVASGPVATTNRFGIINKAYQFDGVDDVVTIASLASTNLTELTISTWVKPTANGEMYIVNKWAAFSSALSDWSLTLLAGRYVHFGNGRHGPAVAITCSESLALNEWSHVAATLDAAGNAVIWVNGSLKASGNLSPLLPPTSVPVRIGQMVSGSGGIVDSFSGSIDDLRIYNRALSATEVQQLYTYELQAQPCIPHRAVATATVVNGFLVGATLTDSGCGYTNVPAITVLGTGTGASAVATVENGLVTGIAIVSAGSGYGTNTTLRFASPPFIPWLEMSMSRVKLTMHVVAGKSYVVEVSPNMVTWTQVGEVFTPEDEVIVQEFEVGATGRYFRLRQVQ